MDRNLLSICAVPRRMIFCNSLMLLAPVIFPKFWSIPSLISPTAPTITDTVSVLFSWFQSQEISHEENWLIFLPWMGADCNCFLKRLDEKLSEKNVEPYYITTTWIRTLLSFEILRSVHTCVRGSRTPFHKIPQRDFIDDCRLNATQACMIIA